MRRLDAGASLSEAESAAVIGSLMDGTLDAAQASAVLKGLAGKGETPSELLGAARAMRARSLVVEHEVPLVVDVVGSGGDRAGTINISTLAAIVVASAGVPVAKHGNRAASGQCGTADVLEAAGLNIDMPPQRAAESLRQTGFAFMFAQAYHPAMKNVGPVRKALGIRTIFNLLGPLTNPARATHQLVGVARREHVELVGDVLTELGVRGAVVHASSGMDEIGGEGPTAVYEFGNGISTSWSLDPQDYGVSASAEEIYGGPVAQCLEAFESVLNGERSPRADVVALNAAMAFRICGKTADIKEGMDLARTQLYEGRAAALFRRAAEFSHG